MGKFGRKRVLDELAWEYSVPNLLAAYQRAFSKRERKSSLSQSTDLEPGQAFAASLGWNANLLDRVSSS